MHDTGPVVLRGPRMERVSRVSGPLPCLCIGPEYGEYVDHREKITVRVVYSY